MAIIGRRSIQYDEMKLIWKGSPHKAPPNKNVHRMGSRMTGLEADQLLINLSTNIYLIQVNCILLKMIRKSDEINCT